MNDDVDIILISYDNICGVLGNLCEAINKYTPYNARYASAARNYINMPMDLDLAKQNDIEKLNEYMKKCTTIVWHDLVPEQREKYLRAWKVNIPNNFSSKNHAYHFHGSVLRSKYPLKNCKKVFVSTPDLTFYAPHATYLPNIVDVRDFKTLKSHYPEYKRIIQCPTVTITIGDYLKMIHNLHLYPTTYPLNMDLKSSNYFESVMKKISKITPVNYEIVKNVTYKISLKKKSQCSMLFDQLWLGSYGVNAIESMYLGKPVLARIGDHSKKCYSAWGEDECPILQVDYHTLEDDIKKYLKMDEKILGKESKKWVKRAHSPRKVSRMLVEKLLEE